MLCGNISYSGCLLASFLPVLSCALSETHASSLLVSLFSLIASIQPETQIKTGVKTVTKKKQKQAQKQSSKSGEPVQKRKEEFEDAPMYKLMLLQDDGADPEHVITRMCAIMEDLDEDAASTVFRQAQSAGKAMCGKYPFERAELFKEQLLRSTPMIFADMEEENA